MATTKALRLCPNCGLRPIAKTHPVGLQGHDPRQRSRHWMLMCPKCFPAACHSALFARGVTLEDAVNDWNAKVEASHG